MGLTVNQDFTTTIGPNLLELNSRGQWWVAFTDLRQAQECATNIINNHPSWVVEPVNENHFRHGSRLSPCGLSMEDQVIVVVYSGPGTDPEAPNLLTAVKSVLELVGPVCTIREISDESPRGESRFEMHELVVRYFDAQHAVNAIKALNTIRTEVCCPSCYDIMKYVHVPNIFHRPLFLRFFLTIETLEPIEFATGPHLKKFTEIADLHTPTLICRQKTGTVPHPRPSGSPQVRHRPLTPSAFARILTLAPR